MKKTCIILGSILGGAMVGSAVTMLCCPKSGAEFRRDAHKMMVDKFNKLQEQIKGMGCNCDCDSEKSEELATQHDSM